MHGKYSEGQETGAIAPAPKNPRKTILGRGRFFFFLNNLSHFIHFQLQNNAPYALKLHLK
jgi:hypothetical protein